MKLVMTAIAMVMVTSVSPALMQAYSVEPVKAAWSGWTDTIPGYDYISQTITCNFDSLKRVELFAGEYDCTGLTLLSSGR